MQILIKLDLSENKQTLQSQVFELIREQISTGSLKPGVLIPSTRLLSEQIGVSRNTVSIAYDRLITEGYIHTQKTVGTFVNPNLPDDLLMFRQCPTKDIVNQDSCGGKLHMKKQSIVFEGREQTLFNPYRDQLDIDFWVGRPDPKSFPMDAWRKLTMRHLSHAGSSMTEYHDPVGIFDLRKAIAEYLRPARGINASPNQIVIVNGIQEALNLVARLWIKKDTPVVMESPCYQGAAHVFESYGAKLHPVPVDEDGLDVSKLPEKQISLAYVTPSHQYPMGSTLPLERRVSLLNWAQRNGAYIIEDDYDSDFRHQGSPLTAVAGQDPYGCVIYMGTFSKSIGAALRLGYMVVPEELIESIRVVKALMNNGHAWLDQVVLKDFIVSGAYIKHLRRIRRTYLNRRNCLVDALRNHFGDVQLSGLEGGMHLVWHLPVSLPESEEVQKIAQDVGVGVYSLPAAAGHNFGKKGYRKRALLFGYSSTSEAQILDGIERLATVLKKHVNLQSL